jgi:hypothetical protein
LLIYENWKALVLPFNQFQHIVDYHKKP